MKTRFTALLALLLLAAIALSRLEADSGTAADPARSATTPSTTTTTTTTTTSTSITTTNAPPTPTPSAAEHMKTLMLKMAHRLVEVQQKTPDDKIKALITQYRLDDNTYINSLTPDDSRKTVFAVAIGLYQASKTDPLAVQLMKEFQITYTSNTKTKTTGTPETNAPPAVPNTQAIGT